MLTQNFFIQNRQKLREKISPGGLVVITAQSLLQRSADTTYPFRQESNFFYLTGVEIPDVVLVMQDREEFLIIPKRSEVETIFGGQINRDEIAKTSGIHEVLDFKAGWERYKKMQQGRKNIYTLYPAPAKVSGIDSFYTNPARRGLIKKLKRLTTSAKFQDLRPQLVQLRQVKGLEEVATLHKAIEVTAEGFVATHKTLQNNTTEQAIEAIFDATFKTHLARHGYQPIVAAADRACILHYTQNNQVINTTDLCLLDIGAEFNNYSADISRTYVSNPSPRQKAVLDAVKHVQDQAIAMLAPGMQWKDYARSVEEVMGQALVELGLITQVSQKNIRKYFPHAISHSLGLDVHDVCEYVDIKEHMIITVEPGIYIPEEGIGVRIEDNVLITTAGAQNLSEMIPYY